jgi:hypothetical protein
MLPTTTTTTTTTSSSSSGFEITACVAKNVVWVAIHVADELVARHLW